MNRKLKDYAFIALKGMGMGAADVVPGVSGGTIAFIVGIYEELLDSIKSINIHSLKLFFTGRLKEFLESHQRELPFLLAFRYRRQCIVVGTRNHLSTSPSAHSDLGLLFRIGIGFYLVCLERY